MSSISDQEIERRVTETRSLVLERIGATKPRRVSSRTRAGVAIAVASAGVLSLTAGVVVVAMATPEQVSYSVNCYEKASLSSTYTTATDPEATSSNGTVTRTRTNPISSCAAMWKMGLLGQATPPSDPNTAHFPVPALVGCTMANGVGAGFPRGQSSDSDADFCSGLGLTPWQQ